MSPSARSRPEFRGLAPPFLGPTRQVSRTESAKLGQSVSPLFPEKPAGSRRHGKGRSAELGFPLEDDPGREPADIRASVRSTNLGTDREPQAVPKGSCPTRRRFGEHVAPTSKDTASLYLAIRAGRTTSPNHCAAAALGSATFLGRLPAAFLEAAFTPAFRPSPRDFANSDL